MKAARELMQQGVDERVFPGGVLLIAREGRVLFFEAFGRARLIPERPMTTHTVFDLASLTKPLATTVGLMRLVQQKKLNLDQTLGTAITAFSETNKKEVTIRQLLSHTSGFPDYRPYYKTLIKLPPADRKSKLRDLLIDEDVIHEPGRASVYSDLGYMVLEWAVEVASEEKLDAFVERSIYRPLGLEHLFFIPLNQSQPKENHHFAATEDCPWRGKILEGEVHDENAYALGGVAGHAGLFGTAQDVCQLLEALLNAYTGKSNTGLFDRGVVQTFFERQSDLGSWALGFDTPSETNSSSGHYFSNESVGHLGFTGTSFWMDLRKGVIVILLTNRIHPTRENERIKAFRPLLHDTVMGAIL
ncbi:MAG: serine hydrolase [Deltaproteobacteria bacterium]|nr:serine hydrolase [Deltaproteobacteria bacterium]MBW2019102.1 serine hydrolase [Deltaproteobacteria bacterium]MBW2073507.1 serine hydrolase [Deltaproteobacteria bacterium]RLB80869.1 MAG: serine hydrolase [Deltaproteobacteria bacterium]